MLIIYAYILVRIRCYMGFVCTIKTLLMRDQNQILCLIGFVSMCLRACASLCEYQCMRLRVRLCEVACTPM